MDPYPTAETWTAAPGAVAPADGNYAAGAAPTSSPAGFAYAGEEKSHGAGASVVGAQHAAPLLGKTADDLGPNPSHPFGVNNERLEELKPKLVLALRDLVRQDRE